jgi:hypothetical protein
MYNQPYPRVTAGAVPVMIVLLSVLLFSCKMEQKQISRLSEVIHPEWSRNAVIYEVTSGNTLLKEPFGPSNSIFPA